MPKFWLITFENYENMLIYILNRQNYQKQAQNMIANCLSRHGWGIPYYMKSAGGTTDNS